MRVILSLSLSLFLRTVLPSEHHGELSIARYRIISFVYYTSTFSPLLGILFRYTYYPFINVSPDTLHSYNDDF